MVQSWGNNPLRLPRLESTHINILAFFQCLCLFRMPSSKYEHEDNQTSAEPLLGKTKTVAPAFSLRKQYIEASIVAFVLVVVFLFLWAPRSNFKRRNDGVCQQPAVRREWRALSGTERLEYLRAVKCLSSIPSKICNGTLHDEFAYVHRKIGDYCTYPQLLL